MTVISGLAVYWFHQCESPVYHSAYASSLGWMHVDVYYYKCSFCIIAMLSLTYLVTQSKNDMTVLIRVCQAFPFLSDPSLRCTFCLCLCLCVWKRERVGALHRQLYVTIGLSVLWLNQLDCQKLIQVKLSLTILFVTSSEFYWYGSKARVCL